MKTYGIKQMATLAIILILAVCAVSVSVSAYESIPGYGVPADLNGDGLADDFNGDGVSNYEDLKIAYDNRGWIAEHYAGELNHFDYDGNGVTNTGDVRYAYSYVASSRVYSPVPGYIVPADTNGDGLADDFNGDGVANFDDIQILYDNRYWIVDNYAGELEHFDYDGNGITNLEDVRYAYQWSQGTLPTVAPRDVPSLSSSTLPGGYYITMKWDEPEGVTHNDDGWYFQPGAKQNAPKITRPVMQGRVLSSR